MNSKKSEHSENSFIRSVCLFVCNLHIHALILTLKVLVPLCSPKYLHSLTLH